MPPVRPAVIPGIRAAGGVPSCSVFGLLLLDITVSMTWPQVTLGRPGAVMNLR